MDNAINKVVTDAVLGQLDSLIEKVLKADEALIKASQSANAFSKTMGTPPKTSDALNKQLQESQKLIKQLQDDYKKQESALASLQKKYESLANTKKSVNATDRQTIIDNREIRKELDGQAIANSNLTSYIQKLSVERAKASRIVADYNAQVAMGTALTEEQSAELAQATTAFQKYDNAIKSGKKSIGDAREYVGQYERANWGLQNSVNQLSRELPALGINASTFFLAISNNIGPFKDAIDDINVRNAQLRAEGKQTESAWKQIGNSLLSLNTLLSIGVTLLVVYGKEISNFAKELFGAKTVMDNLNESMKEMNDAQVIGVKNSFQDTQAIKGLIAVTRNVDLAMKYRNEGLTRLKEQYPDYFQNLEKETVLNGKVKASIDRLYSDIQKKEQADQLDKNIIKNQERILEINQEINKIIAENPNLPSRQNIVKMADLMITGDEQKYKDYVLEINGLYAINANAQKEVNRLRGESAGLLIRQTKDTDDNTRAIKLNTKAREDYLASEYELWRLRKQNESNRNKEIMQDEASGYELRLMASEQYYQNELDLANRAAEEELRVLSFSTEERKRVAENEFTNSKEQLDTWLKDSKISRSQYNKGIKDAEQQLQYDRDGIIKDATNKQNIIYENQAQRLIDLNRELVGEMERAWNEINFGKADVLIDERSLKGFEDLGKLLKGIGDDMSIGEIQTKLAEINRIQIQHNQTIRRAELQAELDRAEAEKRRIENAIETDGKLNGLTDSQIQAQKNSNKTLIDLDKQIIKSKEDIAKADNETTQTQIDNALKLKEAKLAAQIELGQELGNLANQLFDNTVSYYDREIEKSNEYYDALLENAEAGSEQEMLLQEEKQRKEEELQKKKISIQRKQAIFNKFLALADIALNLQAEIAKNNATLGTIPAQPVNALAIASAAIRTATVLATPLPQYKDGRGKGKDEFAIVGDGGRSEVIERKGGKLEVTPSVPTITHLGKDDIVHKSLDDFEQSRLAIQNASIMASFGSQSRQLEMFDYYLGKELRGISSKIEKGIERGFKKAKVQNFIKIPQVDVGHLHYKNRGLT
jgi:hypothetical protein